MCTGLSYRMTRRPAFRELLIPAHISATLVKLSRFLKKQETMDVAFGAFDSSKIVYSSFPIVDSLPEIACS